MAFTLFETITNLFKSRKGALESVKRLRELNYRLAKDEGSFFNPSSQKFGSHIGSAFEQFSTNNTNLRSVLRETIGDEVIATIRERLILRLLQAKGMSPVKLTFTDIKHEINQYDREGILKMKKLFRYRISVFKTLKMKDFQKQFAGLRKLQEFVNFDLEPIVESFRAKKGFRSVKGMTIIDQLEDLYYLQSSLKPDRESLKLLMLLLSIRKKLTKKSQDEMVRQWSVLEDYWGRFLPSDRLLAVIRSIHGNPDHIVKSLTIKERFVEEYVDKTTEKFKIQASQYREALEQKQRDILVLATFGLSDLDDLAGLNRNDESIMYKETIPPLPIIEALRVTKTFAIRFVDELIQPAMNNLLSACSFVNLETEERLKNAVETLYMLSLDIKSLEMDMEERHAKTIGIWVKKIQEGVLDEISLQKALVEFQRIGRKADEIVQKALSSIISILKTHKLITEDLTTKDQIVISNGRILFQQEMPMLRSVEDAVGRMKGYANLMGKYVVDKARFQEKMQGGLLPKSHEKTLGIE